MIRIGLIIIGVTIAGCAVFLASTRDNDTGKVSMGWAYGCAILALIVLAVGLFADTEAWEDSVLTTLNEVQEQ